MTVKERIHQLIDELPEEELATAEQRLRDLRDWAARARGQAEAERRAVVLSLRGSCRGAKPDLNDFLREKREETEREE